MINEAKMRCLKTVVIGDIDDGFLKRTADTAFSWEEILMGKAKKQAVSVGLMHLYFMFCRVY